MFSNLRKKIKSAAESILQNEQPNDNKDQTTAASDVDENQKKPHDAPEVQSNDDEVEDDANRR